MKERACRVVGQCLKLVRQAVGVPPKGPSMAIVVVQDLAEVSRGGHTKMVVGPSAGTFPDPVESGSYMELGKSTVNPPQAHYPTLHSTMEEHGIIVGIHHEIGTEGWRVGCLHHARVTSLVELCWYQSSPCQCQGEMETLVVLVSPVLSGLLSLAVLTSTSILGASSLDVCPLSQYQRYGAHAQRVCGLPAVLDTDCHHDAWVPDCGLGAEDTKQDGNQFQLSLGLLRGLPFLFFDL